MKISKVENLYNYLIAYLIIATTGIHFFSTRNVKLGIVIFLIFMFFVRKRGLKKSFFFWGISFSFLILLQQFMYASLNIPMWLNTLIPRFLIPWFLYLFIGDKFPKYFVKIILVYGAISLILWSVDNIIPGFHSLLVKIAQRLQFLDPVWHQQFILYTATPAIQQIGPFIVRRNPGPFHEPGVFALLLLVALILELIKDGGELTRKSIFMIIVIITTLSTAGFLGLYVLFAYKILFTKKIHPFIKMVYFGIFIFVATYFFLSSEMMYGKIEQQLEMAQQKSIHEEAKGRFYSSRKIFNAIKQAPIFGRGLSKISEVKDMTSEIYVRYSFLTTVVELGIPLFLFYLYNLFRWFSIYIERNKFDSKFKYFIFVTLLINLYSQNFMISSVFIYFVYASFDIKNKRVV